MGQILHGCARTTEATRRAIQNSQESLRVLAGTNPKTVAKWRKREATRDLAMGPEAPEVHGSNGRGGGNDRRLPQTYPSPP